MDFMMMELKFAKVKIILIFFFFFKSESSYQCLNCEASKDNCNFYFKNPEYFRNNVLPTCNCLDGYYDDDILFINVKLFILLYRIQF